MSDGDKYVQMALDLNMRNARMIAPGDIVFDLRALLKCRWGCRDYFKPSIKCHPRNTSFQERVDMLKAYQSILLVHAHDAGELSQAVLEIERAAFLDGHYFSFAVRYCKLCQTCPVDQNKPCPTPEKVRPCDQSFGIDVYNTVRNQGLPCDVLQTRQDVQNRYGFVLIK